jgi:hypothetical protein
MALELTPKRNYLLVRKEKIELHGGLILPDAKSSIRYVVVKISADVEMKTKVGDEVIVDGTVINVEPLGAAPELYLIQEHQIVATVTRTGDDTIPEEDENAPKD